jgi:hypothetical protein
VSPSLKNLLLSVLAGGSVLAVIAVAVIAGARRSRRKLLRLRSHRAAARPPICRFSASPAALTPRFSRPAVSSFDRVVRK